MQRRVNPQVVAPMQPVLSFRNRLMRNRMYGGVVGGGLTPASYPIKLKVFPKHAKLSTIGLMVDY